MSATWVCGFCESHGEQADPQPTNCLACDRAIPHLLGTVTVLLRSGVLTASAEGRAGHDDWPLFSGSTPGDPDNPGYNRREWLLYTLAPKVEQAFHAVTRAGSR